MLFNSYIFIFLFLPITIGGFFFIGNVSHHRVAISWLIGASLFFYGWWNPAYLGLILGSILFNYAFGLILVKGVFKRQSKKLLTLGIIVNLTLLGYFKYTNFLIDSLNNLFDSNWDLKRIILPLAISFFTFQQIAFLVDSYRRETREYNFLHYCLFVTFFPQLIAGPIVHHREMMPQFVKDHIYSINYKFITTGLSIFSIGLFKKVMIADSMALYATPVFTAAAEGTALSFFEAWFGSLAYTFQLYFDFSGYSDMAIGLAFLFGIRLPANFYSPYKAVNIIDFWRRWHITLSRFLLFYLYIPLGGNRKGQIHRYFNLMITMVLGGLWHGAALNFVFWGTLHGFFLAINHAWHGFRRILGHNLKKSTRLGRCMSQIFTFSLLVITWVFFRAESFDSAMSMVKAMMGHNGLSLPASFQGAMGNFVPFLLENGVIFNGLFYNGIIGNLNIVFWFFALFIIVWYFPNTQQFMAEHSPALDIYHRDVSDSINKRLIWQPTYKWALLMATMTTITIIGLSRASEFIYFQF